MLAEQKINRREFIRNFRKYQELLSSEKVECLTIALGDHHALDVRLKRRGKTGADIANFMRNLKKPIIIKRPNFDLFSRCHGG